MNFVIKFITFILPFVISTILGYNSPQDPFDPLGSWHQRVSCFYVKKLKEIFLNRLFFLFKFKIFLTIKNFGIDIF